MIEYNANINISGNRYCDFEEKLNAGVLTASRNTDLGQITYNYAHGLVTTDGVPQKGDARKIALTRLFASPLRAETTIQTRTHTFKKGMQPHFTDFEHGVIVKIKNYWHEIVGTVHLSLAKRDHFLGSIIESISTPNYIPLILARIKLRNPQGPIAGIGRFGRSTGQLDDNSQAWITQNPYNIWKDQHDNAGYMLISADPSTLALYGYSLNAKKKRLKRDWGINTIRLKGVTEPAAAFIASQLPYVI